MILCPRVGSIIRHIFKVHGFPNSSKVMLVTLCKKKNGKKMSSSIEKTTSVNARTTQSMGQPQPSNNEKKTTKPENKKFNWKKLKNKLSKLPNDKKEGFMEDMTKAISSRNSNIFEDESEKKKFQLMRRSFIAFLRFGILFVWVNFKIMFGGKSFGPLEFPNFQKPGNTKKTVTFDDVKGMDEARAELMEIVEYLREPKKYVRLGGKLPKGVLLVGLPGTDKTLLARAIASEVNIPFFYKSGSDFDGNLFGQGAKRVRDLFRTARNNAPCIIFIDSIGSKRISNGLHPFTNQTTNQLLTEMDGFDNNERIIVIGTTNRPEDLDEALLRSGRFDIRVNCPKPDLPGRIEIFKHYLNKIAHGNIDIDVLAKMTIDFLVAYISNVVNQAALKAATEGCQYVMQKHLEDIIDRVIMGPARIKKKLPDKESNRITSYHEAGHSLVALYTPYVTPLHKVIIIPKQNSLDHISFMPEKDKYHTTKAEISGKLDVKMGSRVAKKPIPGKGFTTTDASNDSRNATSFTKTDTKKFGISRDIPLRKYKSYTCQKSDGNDVNPQVKNKIYPEVHKTINKNYTKTKPILTKKAIENKRLAGVLLKKYRTLIAEKSNLL